MVTVVDRVPTVQVSSAAGINRSVDLSVASGKDVQVAAFLTWRLRHFQKQVSIEEQLKRSGSRVQVELKFEHPGPWKSGGFGSPHWNAVTGVPRSRVRISPAPPLYPAVTYRHGAQVAAFPEIAFSDSEVARTLQPALHSPISLSLLTPNRRSRRSAAAASVFPPRRRRCRRDSD